MAVKPARWNMFKQLKDSEEHYIYYLSLASQTMGMLTMELEKAKSARDISNVIYAINMFNFTHDFGMPHFHHEKLTRAELLRLKEEVKEKFREWYIAVSNNDKERLVRGTD